jgi:hypothetical protein
VWDIAAGNAVFSTNLPVVLYSGTYSPDGQRLAVTANDHKSYLIDLPAAAQ